MLRFQSPRLKRKIILLCQLSCGFSVVTELLFAQGGPAQEETRQVITGTVTQAGTPLAGARVAISPGPGTTTDADGHFSFPGLMARRYRVSTWSNGIVQEKFVTIRAGHDVKIDLNLPRPAHISGTVLDENKEPLPNADVLLVGREYAGGAIQHVFRNAVRTDDRGAYRLDRAIPGVPYLVLARVRRSSIPSISSAPVDPEKRRRVLTPTFYPGVTTTAAATPIVLREGQELNGIDIVIPSQRNYCTDGRLGVAGRPASVRFEIASVAASAGSFEGGGYFETNPGGMTEPDGRLRVCDLAPGDYRLTSYVPHDPSSSFGSTIFTITDRDVHDVQVPAAAGAPVRGEVVWSGKAPERETTPRILVALHPMHRAPFGAERQGLQTTPSVPGQFLLPGVLFDDYKISLATVPKDLYVQELRFAGRPLTRGVFQPGSAPPNSILTIVIGTDGVNGRVAVRDKDGAAIPDASIAVYPTECGSAEELAEVIIIGQTDQDGIYESPALKPGKWNVTRVANLAPYSFREPTVIQRIWADRGKAETLEIRAGQAAALTITVDRP